MRRGYNAREKNLASCSRSVETTFDKRGPRVLTKSEIAAAVKRAEERSRRGHCLLHPPCSSLFLQKICQHFLTGFTFLNHDGPTGFLKSTGCPDLLPSRAPTSSRRSLSELTLFRAYHRLAATMGGTSLVD